MVSLLPYYSAKHDPPKADDYSALYIDVNNYDVHYSIERVKTWTITVAIGCSILSMHAAIAKLDLS